MSNFEVGVRLTADGRKLVGEANEARRAIGGLSGEQRKASAESATYTSQINRQNSALSSLKTGVIAAAGAYVSFNAAIAGGKAVIDAALAQERLNNSLRVGLGSQQAATKEIRFLREESDKLGLQFTSTAQQYAKLAAASKGTVLEGQKTRDIFLSVAKASTVLGLSAADTSGVLTAYQQIISKGKVSTEELLQIAERVPGTFAAVARAMDRTGEELSDMLRKGEILAEDLLPRLAAENERTYGAEAQNAAQGLNAQINRLDNSFTDLKLAVAEAGVIDLFSEGITAATEFIGVTTQVIGQLRAIGEEASKIPGIGQVASNVTPGNIIKAVTGNNILGNIYSSGILGRLFGKDARAEITATTQELEKAEEVINKIVRPGAKPEAPKEFAQALKQEAAERKKIADQIAREAQRAAKEREREAQQAVDASRRIIESLRRETQEIGLNNVQKRLLTAATEAAKAPTQELAAEIMASAQAWAQATEAQEQALAQQKQQQEAAQARARAETEAARQVQQEWGRVWGAVENTARTSFVQFAAHGKDAIESIGRSIQNSIIDVLYQLTIRPWIINVGTNLLGTGGGNIGSLLTTGGSLFSSSVGGGSGGSFLGGTKGAGSLLSTASLAGPYGVAAAAAVIALRYLDKKYGNYEISGTNKVIAQGLHNSINPTGAIDTSIAQFEKLIGTNFVTKATPAHFLQKTLGIQTIESLIAKSLFGLGRPKFKREEIIGEVGASGFKGIVNQLFNQKGGLLKKSRVSNFIIDSDTGELLSEFGRRSESGNFPKGLKDAVIEQAIERAKQLGSVLDESITATAKSLRSVAETLDISTESLDNFSLSVDLVSEKGKQLDDAQIAQVIADAAEQMATGLIPEIGKLANRGESAVQTFVRLGSEFSALEGALRLAGNTSSEAQALLQSYSLEQRSAAAELAGGVDALNSKTQLFFNNVLTDAQKFDIVSADLRTELEKYGITKTPTIEQLNAAVTSGKLSFEQFTAAMDLTPLIIQANQYRDSIQKAAVELGYVIDASTELPRNNGDPLKVNYIDQDTRRAILRREEIDIRRQATALLAEQRKIEREAAEALKIEVNDLRAALISAGDAAGAVANQLRVDGVKQSEGQFVASDFNAAMAAQIAKISAGLANEASANALRIQNVNRFVNTLIGNIVSHEVVKPVYLGIRNAIVDGSGDMSNAVRDAVNGFAKTLAFEQVRSRNTPRGRGLAAVLSARADLNAVQQLGFVDGQVQFGRDVLAYGQAIDKLNARLDSGAITTDVYTRAVTELDRVMGQNANLLGDTEGQLKRIRDANIGLFQAGISSIAFYFNDIAKQTAELNAHASQSGAAIAKTTEAIGRLNSVSTVFSASAAAVIDGLRGAGDRFEFALAQELSAGSRTSKAKLISEAAAIASSVLTTADAAKFATRLTDDPAFADTDKTGLRDISLLLDGLTAFDAQSFENSFLRINNALIQGRIDEQQFGVLFNTALDTFEGLNDSAGGVNSAFNQLRDAARSAADELLLDHELSTLSNSQSLAEAQRQFDALIGRVRSGDTGAAGALSGSTNDLLRIGRVSAATQGEYNVLFGRTINELRSIEALAPERSQRLDVQPVVDELQLLRAEVEKLRLQNNTNSKATSRNTKKTRKQLQMWDANGLPATET